MKEEHAGRRNVPSRRGRRVFLKLTAFASGAALAGPLAAAGVAARDVAAAQTPEQDSRESSGYRETAHIRTYYERARF